METVIQIGVLVKLVRYENKTPFYKRAINFNRDAIGLDEVRFRG